MSLETLSTDVSSLAGLNAKESGSLIKHTDWNGLAASVQGIGGALIEYIAQTDGRISQLEALLSPLTQRIDGLETELDDLQTNINPLLNQYVVTMRTAKVNYALGELCEITAVVRDLSGNIVTSRPWIDFVTTWGQLRSASGFTTDSSAIGSSISVRANNEGIARVRVRAENAENLTETQELQVATAIEATLPSGQFFYQAIMDSPTPSSEPAVQAFALMNLHYEQIQSGPMQLFIDSYIQTPAYQLAPQIVPGFWGNWRNYRTVVMAMVKDDSDPTTPDAAKGSASIQIQFRDWLGPWINDYVHDYEVFVPDIIAGIGPQIINGDFALNLDSVEAVITTGIGNLGLIGRQRYYNAVLEAMDQVDVSDPPPYMSNLRRTVKNAVTVQQMQENPSVALQGNQLGSMPGFTAINGVSRHAAAAKDSADATLGSVEAIQESTRELGNRILALDSEVQITQQASTAISNELSSIGQNVLRIDTLDQNSVQGQINTISAQVGKIHGILNRG